MSVLAGGVFAGDIDGDLTELHDLVDEIGRRSAEDRLGRRRLPEVFDDAAWGHLDETGLARLTSTLDLDAGPREAAVVLRGLARHAVAGPVAETDLLAAWLAGEAGLELPETGPLTIALTDGVVTGGQVHGTAKAVPWSRAAARLVLVVRTADRLLITAIEPTELTVADGHNLAGEPRADIEFSLPAAEFTPVSAELADELTRRGAWARCVQCIGALDAAAELAVAHVGERVQFGRPLSGFQAVQHALAALAGEIERGRAATELAVAAAADHGFADHRTDHAVTVAKVTMGRVVPAVVAVAHQLHGAIGVTIEHPLWSVTNRARSWIDEFGSTGHYARRLGRLTLAHGAEAGGLWDVLTAGP